jgi:hypothetical protein
MNDEKQVFNIKKDNDNFKWMQTQCDMVFYNYENKQNFPLIINFPKLNSNNQNNINVYNKQSTNDNEIKKSSILGNEEDDLNKQNFNIDEFLELLKKKRTINTIYPRQELEGFIKNKLKLPTELNSNESNHSNISNTNFPTTNQPFTDNNDNESIEKLIYQLINTNDLQIKNKTIKKLVISRKKLHKEKLENFYVEIAKALKEKIEDVKEWVSLEEKLMRIDNLNSNICRELGKYIKVHQSGKIQLENVSSKDFLRVHFIGSIKVKMNDFNITLKSYK